jgi:hypothetical protein
MPLENHGAEAVHRRSNFQDEIAAARKENFSGREKLGENHIRQVTVQISLWFWIDSRNGDHHQQRTVPVVSTKKSPHFNGSAYSHQTSRGLKYPHTATIAAEHT